MTIFKVGDVVTPKNEEHTRVVVSQLRAKGRELPSPPYFKVVEVNDCLGGGALILRYECGYHTSSTRMKLVPPLDKPLEDYL